MLEIPHTVVGAAIGLKIANPLISIPVAFASHFLLDLVPHWNPSLYTETQKHGQPSKKSIRIVVIDTILSLVIGFFIASRVLPDTRHFLVIIFSCFAAVAPDVSEAPYFFMGIRPKWLEKWVEFQHHHQGRAKKIPGLLIQLIPLIIALVIIFS
jgi:hypothetical protein